MNLAGKAAAIQPRTGTSPWDGHEYGRGYAVLSCPFSSGDLLGLRVFPQNDFAPYVSVWHRTPDGEWSIYVDGPALEAACPRYWGGATERTALTTVDVTWTGPTGLHVTMADPDLDWTLSLSASRLLRVVNAVGAALPLWTWRPGPLLALREWAARRYLGMGEVELSFRTARGQRAVLVAAENYVIEDSAATLGGRSLGDPVALDEEPTIGDVALPRVPTFVFGEAHAEITDRAEYERLREQVRER